MSNLSEKIKEREKKSRQNKLTNNILGFIVVIFMVVSVMLYSSLKEQKANLQKSEKDLQASEKSLIDSNKALKEKDSILMLQNEKLLALRGSIETFWNDAQNSNRLRDYANYIERAIEGDEHYAVAINKMIELAAKKGYVQITDSDGTKYLSKIEGLNTKYEFFRVGKAMNVRNGVLGDNSFSNTSRNGDVLNIEDVVKLGKVYTFNSGAEWAEIYYKN